MEDWRVNFPAVRAPPAPAIEREALFRASLLHEKGCYYFKSDKNKVFNQTPGPGFLASELVPSPSPVVRLGINPSSAS